MQPRIMREMNIILYSVYSMFYIPYNSIVYILYYRLFYSYYRFYVIDYYSYNEGS